MVILTQDVQDLAVHCNITRSDHETLRKRNMELAGEVWKKVLQATLQSAWLFNQMSQLKSWTVPSQS